MHYIELDDNGAFHGVYPLNEEIAGTAFYDGVQVPVLSSEPAIGFKQVMGSWPALTEKMTPGCSVHIYRYDSLTASASSAQTTAAVAISHIEDSECLFIPDSSGYTNFRLQKASP